MSKIVSQRQLLSSLSNRCLNRLSALVESKEITSFSLIFDGSGLYVTDHETSLAYCFCDRHGDIG